MNHHPRDIMPEFGNLDAEQDLIGSLIRKPELSDILPVEFTAEHFTEPLHREIFEVIGDLRKAERSVNPVSVKGALSTTAQALRIGDMSIAQYLAHCVTIGTGAFAVPGLAQAIIDEANKREIWDIGNRLMQAAMKANGAELPHFIDGENSRLETVVRGLAGKATKTLAAAAALSVEHTATASQKKTMPGIDYGFRPLMEMIGPFQAGELIIIGGATKQGKSALIDQMVAGAAKNGHPVWIYSGEMSGEDLARRALSRDTDIQTGRQTRGQVSDAEIERLEIARARASSWQERVFLRDDAMTLAQIEREVKAFGKSHRGGMIVVDHIGLVSRDRETYRMSPHEFGPFVTMRLKALAKDAGVSVIAAAQLKKNTFVGEGGRLTKSSFTAILNRRPRASDLVGNCEQDATHVICPFRPEPMLGDIEPHEFDPLHADWQAAYDQAKGKAEIVLAVSRHARFPQRREVEWIGAKTTFQEKKIDQEGFI